MQGRSVSIAKQIVNDLIDIFPQPCSRIGLASSEGVELLIKPSPSGMEVTVLDTVYKMNVELLNAIALTMRSLITSLNRLQALVDSLKQFDDRGLAESVTQLVSRTLSELRAKLRIALNSEVAQLAFARQPLEPLTSVGRYSYLIYAARRLERGLVFEPGFREQAMFFLYPSTKIYELYVYVCIVEAFAHATGSRPRYGAKLAVSLPGTTLYFNRYPAKFSRIIAKLCRRVPKPDIVVSRRDRIAVVDAKYRFLDTVRPRALSLADAERIAAYILDVCRDDALLAFIAALSKPPESSVNAILNGKTVHIEFIEVNPDSENLWSEMKEFLKHIDSYLRAD